MFVDYAPAIHIDKETAFMVSEQVNIICNIEGKLGRIHTPVLISVLITHKIIEIFIPSLVMWLNVI